MSDSTDPRRAARPSRCPRAAARTAAWGRSSHPTYSPARATSRCRSRCHGQCGIAAAAVAGLQHRARERPVRDGLAAEPAGGVPQDLPGVPRYLDAGPGTGGLPADVFVALGRRGPGAGRGQLSGAGAVPAADRGPVRPDRARPRRLRELLGGPQQGRPAHPVRHAPPGRADATWRDPAVVADPGDPGRVFGWRITATQDALGNLIRYAYLPDRGRSPGTRGIIR